MDEKPKVSQEELIQCVYELHRGILGARGITLEYLADKLYEELNANETKIFYDRNTGELVYSATLIAWGIRQKARMDALRLLNAYPPEKQSIDLEARISIPHPVDISRYRTEEPEEPNE